MSIFAALVIVLMLAICLQVACSAFGVNPLVVFESRHFLVGDAITLNSLLDFQWHLLAVIALPPAAMVWARDGHVRVDFIHARLGAGWRSAIDLVGHVALTGPFLFMSLPASWSFVEIAWRSNQGSANDGLNDLWLVKSILPIGLALLAVALLRDVVGLIRRRP